jgi:hypothetical protein
MCATPVALGLDRQREGGGVVGPVVEGGGGGPVGATFP